MSKVAEKIVEFLRQKKEATIKEIVENINSSYTYTYLEIMFKLIPQGKVDRVWKDGKFVYFLRGEKNENTSSQ